MNTETKTARKTTTLNGYKVTFTFSEEKNEGLSAMVRNTIIDGYLRKLNIVDESLEMQMC